MNSYRVPIWISSHSKNRICDPKLVPLHGAKNYYWFEFTAFNDSHALVVLAKEIERWGIEVMHRGYSLKNMLGKSHIKKCRVTEIPNITSERAEEIVKGMEAAAEETKRLEKLREVTEESMTMRFTI